MSLLEFRGFIRRNRANARVSSIASYKIGEVAALLGVSVDSVRRLTDSGRLATVRTAGGQRVVDARQLARYMAAAPAELKPETIVLAPGVRAVAVVKATNVIVELAGR